MRSRTMRIGLLCALAFSLAACIDETPRITAGKDFPFERLVGIRRGISTEKDVRELMGEPYRKDQLSERRQLWRYYMKKEQKSAVLGFLPTGTHVTETELKIILDGGLVESVAKDSQAYRE
jgi:hypothetical protein